MFIDQVKVYARAGHGGKGCVAFHREAYIAKGGPSGGNGGRGGDVILEADHDLNNLIGQYYKPRLIAQDGKSGLGKGMDGHAGKDLVVKVPCGTLVWRQVPTPAEEPAVSPEKPRWGWWVIPTPENQPCSPQFQKRGRKSHPTHFPRSTHRSALWNIRISIV